MYVGGSNMYVREVVVVLFKRYIAYRDMEVTRKYQEINNVVLKSDTQILYTSRELITCTVP